MSTPTPVKNPTTFQIVDTTLIADKVTAMAVSFGTVSGGPYTLIAAVPAVDITGAANGVVSGTLASLNEQLAPGIWYAVASATNATGTSGNSPEVAFEIVSALPLPAAPTGFTLG
jgi:hypothetical protein